MKTLNTLILIVAVMLLASCSKKGDYQKFADTFAEAVSKNDTSVVKEMIEGGKGMSLADINMMPITSSSLQMEELAGEGYKMTWGDKIAIIKPVGDGLAVTELYKVFDFKNTPKVEKAKSLGLLKNEDAIATLKILNSPELVASNGGSVQTESSSAPAGEDLTQIPETFYRKSSKAIPILPSFTKSFGDVMRRTQYEAGYNGIKGYIRYCFWGDWWNRSDSDLSSFSTSGYNVNMIGDGRAEVSVTLTMRLSTPDGSKSLSFDDVFTLVKSGGWKIDDITRDGVSLHQKFRSYRPSMP